MVRRAREEYLYDGCYAHIISRSIRKLKLFKDAEDFTKFIEIIRLAKQKAKFKVFHYCLMQTHFHAVVQIENMKAFSLAMLMIKSRYSFFFHEKYRLSGPVWRERYKSLLIEDEHYLHACGKYIENNPVKAGLVDQAEDWWYSSAGFYHKGREDSLIDDSRRESKARKVDVFLEEEEFFESGHIIGSAFFRFQFYKGYKRV